MYIENDIVPRAKRSLFYTKRTPGVVILDNEESENQNVVGVYIPRLMFGIDATSGPKEEIIKLSQSFILNSNIKNIGKTSVTIRNYALLPFFIIPNVSVPMYKKGENVIIDFADSDIKSMFIMPYKMNEMNVRKTDTASFFVPAKEKENDEVNLENIYALQLDSEKKMVTLIMNKANGEVSRYFIQMNGKEGFVQLSDDNKRVVKISTDTDEILLQNESEASISLTERVVTVECDEYIINAESSVTINTETMTTKAETINEEASTKTSNVDDSSMKGSTLNITYTNVKEKGSSLDSKYSAKVIMDTPIMGVSGMITPGGGIGFEPPMLGQKPLPITSFVDGTGLANFGKPTATAMPVALGPIVSAALKALATGIDAVAGIHSIPPAQSQIVAALEPVLNSKRILG